MNILHAFQWAINNDFETGEAIATGLMDYLNLQDKRQTNVWVTSEALERCETQEQKAKWHDNLGNRLSEMGDREGALKIYQECTEINIALSKITKKPAPLVNALQKYALALFESGESRKAMDQLDPAVKILEPISEHVPDALKDLIEVHNIRLKILKELKDPEAVELVKTIEEQKKRLQL